MFNPIEEKRRLVQDRIKKSFDNGISVPEMVEIEKAHQDGEMHPNGKWVWVSSANGGKGDWRTANGRAHKKHQETNDKKEDNGEKKTIDEHASGVSTDALKRAVADENAKSEVRDAAKKELEKRNDDTKQKKNHDVEYSKMTAAQAQKSLVGKTIKIGGKTAKIMNAFKSSGPGTNKVYVEAVIGGDYLGTYIQLSTEELESGETKWNSKYYGTKGQTIEVGDEEPEKKEVTRESFKEFLDYMWKNISKKDTDEFLNKEYMFMFTVPQKYRSKTGNIHNRVAATIKKLSDVNNW